MNKISPSATWAPMSLDKLKADIDQSLKDSDKDNVTHVRDMKGKIEKWSWPLNNRPIK